MRIAPRFAMAFAVLLVTTGCPKRSGSVVVPPPIVNPAPVSNPVVTTPAPPPAPAPPSAPAPAIAAFDAGAQAFLAGNYTLAADSFQRYLQMVTSGGRRDEALFHLGLVYAAGENWQRTATYLNQLVMEFPRSPLKPAAQLFLKVHNDSDQRIKQLTSELDRLKQIDSERRTRP